MKMDVVALQARCIAAEGCLLWPGSMSQGRPTTHMHIGARRAFVRIDRVLWENAHRTRLARSDVLHPACGNDRCVSPQHRERRTLSQHFLAVHGARAAASTLDHWRMRCRQNDDDDCWIWRGAIHKASGRPLATINRRVVLVARETYRLHQGISQLRHDTFVVQDCDDPRCVNPEHQRAVSQKSRQRELSAAGHFRRDALKRRRDMLFLRALPHVRLDMARARQIRERRANGESVRQLAAAYGIAVSTVYDVTSGRRWIEAPAWAA